MSDKNRLLEKVCSLSKDDRDWVLTHLPNLVRRDLISKLADFLEHAADRVETDGSSDMLSVVRWAKFLDVVNRNQNTSVPMKLIAYIAARARKVSICVILCESNTVVKKLLLEPIIPEQSPVAHPSKDLMDEKMEKNEKDLREIFRQEIQDLTKKELIIREKELREKLEKNYDIQLQKIEKENSILKKKMESQLALMASLLESLDVSHKHLLSASMKEIDSLLVQMCMEVLYKISAEKDLFEKVVEKAVKTVMALSVSGAKVKLLVSEEAFNVLAVHCKESTLNGCIFLDRSLKPAQIRIDDGTSITEAGLIEQLDQLRNALIAELQKDHAL